MKAVFIGASGFGLKCLQVMANIAGFTMAGVLTAPATFGISYRPSGVRNVLHQDLEPFCRERGIPIATLKSDMRDRALLECVKAWEPQIFIVVGWYHMIPESWRSLAPAYGLHASLLPDYSGGAPLVWAMINGEKRTGITLFQLSDGVDDGPIVDRAATEILYEDTIATLYGRIEQLGLKLLVENLPKIAAGTAVLERPDEKRRRTFPQRGPEDGLISWQWAAEDIRNFIRAQTHPYPGAFTKFHGKLLHIWDSSIADVDVGEIGRVVRLGDKVVVQCGASCLELRLVGFDGEQWEASEWWESFALSQESQFEI